ncbi:cortistatin-like [Carlito syrichta]|uniref:Cortistatin-like n=1 Tax=Carlito syrichta TaxID=1868482 RepID=A0A1U7U334_CARSF|nr:cortistatin-like [Carlito syrichta]
MERHTHTHKKNSWRLSLKYGLVAKKRPKSTKHRFRGCQEEQQQGRREVPAACRMPLPPGLLLLLLSGATAMATTALTLDDGPTGQASERMQEAAEIKQSSLLTFLAWWFEWTSQASAGPLPGGEAREVSKRPEGPPLQQSTRQDRTPCKNFFWKTFSSCK